MTTIDREARCTRIIDRADGFCINCGWSKNAHGYPMSQRVQTCERFSLVRQCGALAYDHQNGRRGSIEHRFTTEEIAQ